MSAANYLGYGGVLKVVRTDDTNLKNAAAGVAATDSFTSPKIKNYDNYEESHSNASSWYFAGKTPGKYLNGVKVCVIDGADQILGFATDRLGGGAGLFAENGIEVGCYHDIKSGCFTWCWINFRVQRIS